MLYPNEIEYQPFSDEQIEQFAKSTELQYTSDQWWRNDLDEAARDLIINHCSQQWESPSAVRKKLKGLARYPKRFEVGAASDAVITAIRMGTGWTDDQLLMADKHQEEFVLGVKKVVAHLDNIIEKRKDMGLDGRQSDQAMATFINHLAYVFQSAFGQDPAISNSQGKTPTGHFICFSKAVVAALAKNLSSKVISHISKLPVKLQAMTFQNNSSIFHYLTEGPGCYSTNAKTNRFVDQVEALQIALQEWAKNKIAGGNTQPKEISNIAEGKFDGITWGDLNSLAKAANLTPIELTDLIG